MTVLQKKTENNPIGHLTPEDVERLGEELDAIRQEVLDTRGERDAAGCSCPEDVPHAAVRRSTAIMATLRPPIPSGYVSSR